MSKKKKRKGINYSAMRCPYCGSSVIYRSADGIYLDNSDNTMLYVCSKYPECDSYVRVHKGTTIPVGVMANKKLRSIRKVAHEYFDQIYQSGIMSKREAYAWLSGVISAPVSEAHIGHLSEYYCNIVIEESKKLLLKKKSKKFEVYMDERKSI